MRAVLLDALGTLLRLEPPAPRLRAELRRRGVEVEPERTEGAVRAEIAYYIDHHAEGRDQDSLSDLRDRCAAVVARELGVDADPPTVRAALLASLAFTPFPDAAPALAELRRRGLRVVVASNWDCSLPAILENAGLADLLDGVVCSAMVGRPKPAPDVFEAALRLAGTGPDQALHVGDSAVNDVGGACAAGIRAVLLVRSGRPPAGMPAIRSLAEVPALI